MSRLRGVAVFAYDFVIGDDWRLALAVVLGLVAAAVLAHNGVSAWWALPVVVMVSLGISLHRARKAAGHDQEARPTG
jgi:hypothetical protein